MQTKQQNIMLFIINNLLLLTGTTTVISGLVLQIGFHIGHPGEGVVHQTDGYQNFRSFTQAPDVWGMDYSTWSVIHKYAIVGFALLAGYHIYKHRKWYKTVLINGLFRKNASVLILSTLFLLTALTGFIPWFIDLSNGPVFSRFVLIELHDKITLLLIVFLIYHLAKRMKWYRTMFGKIV